MKRVMLVLLVVSLLFLAGCASLFGLRDRFRPDQPEVPRGVGLSIVDDFPSLGIKEGTAFNVRVKIINYNAKDTDVTVRLKDSLDESFEGIGSDIAEHRTLIGSGTERPTGFDEETIGFGPFDYSDIGTGQTATFTAEATFAHEYESLAELCVDGYNARPKRCAEGQAILTGAQLGADAMRSPVAVTRVVATPYASMDGVTLPMEITIANVGNGFLEDDVIEDISIDVRGFDVKCDRRELKFSAKIKEKTISCTGTGNVEEGGFARPPVEIRYKYEYKTIVDSRTIKLTKEE